MVCLVFFKAGKVSVPKKNKKILVFKTASTANNKKENKTASKFIQEPLRSRFECTLLASLDFGVIHITTDSESVCAPFEVLPLVS